MIRSIELRYAHLPCTHSLHLEHLMHTGIATASFSEHTEHRNATQQLSAVLQLHVSIFL